MANGWQPTTTHRACGPEENPDYVLASWSGAPWLPHELWRKQIAHGAPLGIVCRPDIAGCKARRLTGGTSHQIRLRDQPEDCQGTGYHDPTFDPAARHRGDGIAGLLD